MKLLLVVISLLSLSRARPDLSHILAAHYLPALKYASASSQFSSASFAKGLSSAGADAGAGNGFLERKHIYFFAAPDEEEYSHIRVNIVPNAQRNTKIIFIKAPSYAGFIPEVVAPQSLIEDKTLVYVLVKKPEQISEINVPAGIGTIQTKPEVQFIKYSNAFDAEAKIHSTLQGQQTGSLISEVGGASNFVKSLDAQGAIRNVDQVVTSVASSAQVLNNGNVRVNLANGGGTNYGPAGISGPY